ncbi:LysR family transcriptional regulator [Candidatus Cyanaurora vandensis]|uniref:LysR family transcriptional regulator n=1 Tax=Candidatus Cyanaurora vandensis TaxID=2714958 RepID=UPI00257E0EC4|nr:LysR family transcriptional regulator [Candidatus Cyanaurora vandensis]
MDAKQLQYFLALHNLANFRLAAEQCHISQPGLSKQIMALEAELGGPLFNRRGRKATLTRLGECFLPHARRASRELEQARIAVQELLRPDVGEVCIAGLHSVNTYLLPALLARFRQDHPQIQLRLTSLGSERIIKVLLDRLVDLAVIMGPVHSPELVSTLLYEEELVALVPARHPLTLGSPSLAEVAQYPQVVFREGYAMRTALIQQFRQVGRPLDIAVELNTLEAFKEMVRQEVGIALLPLSAVQNLPPDLVLIHPTGPKLTRRVELVCHKDNYQVPVVAAFARLVREQLPAAYSAWVQRYALAQRVPG